MEGRFTRMLTRRAFVTGAAAAAAGARPLFDGESLNGWRHAGHGLWTVEDGALVGRADHARPGPGYLMSRDVFQDFDLSLEFWVSRGGNSGVYVREPVRQWGTQGDSRPGHGARRGYEIQVDYNDPKNPTGSVYGLRRAGKVVGAEERWNRMRIRCQGTSIRVWVDGEPVNEWNEALAQAGCVGFQIHGQKPHHHVVKYRAIAIETL